MAKNIDPSKCCSPRYFGIIAGQIYLIRWQIIIITKKLLSYSKIGFKLQVREQCWRLSNDSPQPKQTFQTGVSDGYQGWAILEDFIVIPIRGGKGGVRIVGKELIE